MILARPDGHRCVYETREGKGPRGGRRTWSIARCVACGVTEEVRDAYAGTDSSGLARDRITERVPRCPVPIEPSRAEHALRDLAQCVTCREHVVPSLAWAVEFAPEGGDPDVAIQRAWRECESVETLWEAMKAFGVGGRFARYHANDEVGRGEFIGFERDGLMVDLQGESAAVCRALRLHIPRLEWRKP